MWAWRGHAPRERVSWNFQIDHLEYILQVTLHVSVWVEIFLFEAAIAVATRHAPRERVSWNVDALPSSPVVTCHAPRERVSWNSKLKRISLFVKCHAPRERVSWNRACRPSCYLWCKVTLHVSVWVEIYHEQLRHSACWSRSTWACELKWSMTKAQSKLKSHAPRERVSWNRQYLVQWFQLL